MTDVQKASVDGAGLWRVSLDELVALGSRVSRTRMAPLVSRAASSGQQSSRLYGRGMDYAESRVYQAGDDIRRMDWRLTARSGKPHTKLFQEDREGSLMIVVDTHASMHFGTRERFKSVQAARAAACAAWYAVRAGERVGAMAFGVADPQLRPRTGPRGALAVCGALAEWDAIPSSPRRDPLSEALMRARRLLHGASRVLLISDGFSCDELARARLLDLTRHAGVSVLVTADKLELSVPPPGRYPFDLGGERRQVSLQSDRQRRNFQRALGAGPDRLEHLARSLGLPVAVIDTVADPLAAVSNLIGNTRRRR